MGLVRPKSIARALENYRRYSALCTSLTQKALLDYTSKQQFIPDRGFWEKHRKGGYETEIKVPIVQQLKDGFKEIKTEVDLLKSEIKELVAMDPLLISRPGLFSEKYKFM